MSFQSIIDYVIKYNLMFLLEGLLGILIGVPTIMIPIYYSNWKKNRNKKPTI